MTTTKTDFRSKLQQSVAERIENDLRNHAIVQLHRDGDPGRIWRCTNNGSAVLAFTVCAPPGWLIFSGDMGECMWSRLYDMLTFVRSSIKDLNYFSEKASRDSKIREVHTELAEEWLDETEREWEELNGEPMTEDELEKFKEIRSKFETYNQVSDLQKAIFESGMFDNTSSIPSCEYYTYHYLWKIAALKWFIAKLDAGEFTKKNFAWEDQSELYLLQNCDCPFLGNSPVFWREGGSGYTQWIDEAKRWTKEEAESQIRSTRGSHRWEMWPLSQITAAKKFTVDIQDLRKAQ